MCYLYAYRCFCWRSFTTRSQRLVVSDSLIPGTIFCPYFVCTAISLQVLFVYAHTRTWWQKCADVLLFQVISERNENTWHCNSEVLISYTFIASQVGFAAAAPFVFKAVTCPLAGITADLLRRNLLSTKTVRRLCYTTGNVKRSIMELSGISWVVTDKNTSNYDWSLESLNSWPTQPPRMRLCKNPQSVYHNC